MRKYTELDDESYQTLKDNGIDVVQINIHCNCQRVICGKCKKVSVLSSCRYDNSGCPLCKTPANIITEVQKGCERKVLKPLKNLSVKKDSNNVYIYSNVIRLILSKDGKMEIRNMEDIVFSFSKNSILGLKDDFRIYKFKSDEFIKILNSFRNTYPIIKYLYNFISSILAVNTDTFSDISVFYECIRNFALRWEDKKFPWLFEDNWIKNHKLVSFFIFQRMGEIYKAKKYSPSNIQEALINIPQIFNEMLDDNNFNKLFEMGKTPVDIMCRHIYYNYGFNSDAFISYTCPNADDIKKTFEKFPSFVQGWLKYFIANGRFRLSDVYKGIYKKQLTPDMFEKKEEAEAFIKFLRKYPYIGNPFAVFRNKYIECKSKSNVLTFDNFDFKKLNVSNIKKKITSITDDSLVADIYLDNLDTDVNKSLSVIAEAVKKRKE